MANKTKELKVLSFTEDPGPRYIWQGDDSGEYFYHKVLNEAFYNAISEGDNLCLNLDGTSGYMSSFLDEAIGNLVYDFTLDIVSKHLDFISEEEPEWIDMLKNETYKEWEERRLKNNKPNKSDNFNFEPWYRLENNQYEQKIWL